MNIVILVHSLTGGGAERVAALWASGFAERGDEVTLVIQTPSSSTYNLSDKVSLCCIPFPVSNRILLPFLIRLGIARLYYVLKLKLLLHEIKPDVCIGVMGSYARDAYSVSRDINTLIIQTYHGCFDLPTTAPIIRRKDIERCFKKDKKIKVRTVLTQADKLFIGNRMDNVFVIPNPLAFEPLESIPAKKNIYLLVVV